MNYNDKDIEELKREIAALRSDVEKLKKSKKVYGDYITTFAETIGDIYERLKNVELFVFPNLQADINAVARIVPLDPDAPEQEKKKT